MAGCLPTRSEPGGGAEEALPVEVADRVVYMDQGAIVESGHAAQVLSTPVEARTKAFLAAVL